MGLIMDIKKGDKLIIQFPDSMVDKYGLQPIQGQKVTIVCVYNNIEALVKLEDRTAQIRWGIKEFYLGIQYLKRYEQQLYLWG